MTTTLWRSSLLLSLLLLVGCGPLETGTGRIGLLVLVPLFLLVGLFLLMGSGDRSGENRQAPPHDHDDDDDRPRRWW